MSHPVEAARGGSESQLRQGGRALLLSLYTALRSLKLYPVENATVQKALEDLDATTRTLLAAESDVEVRLAGDFIFVNATRLRLELDNYASFSHILAVLRTFQIGALRIHAGATRREWQVLLSLLLSLAERGEADDRFDLLVERLAGGEVRGLEVERASPSENEADTEQAKQAAKRVYSQGVAVTKEVITGARLGRATNVKRVKRAVQLIVDQVLNNETSIVGLTTIRDYDEYTFTHSVNVCIFSVALGKKLGLHKHQLYELGLGALLHDVGKVRMPLELINKTGPLTQEEFAVLQEHPTEGLLSMFDMRGLAELPLRAMLMAYEHHMKIDQTGYPVSARPRDPTLFGRIVAVADGFDAATTKRSYQANPWTPDRVLKEMRDNPARGFDPLLVKAFISMTGIYPVGSVVILDTFELAIVSERNPRPDAMHQPVVQVIYDSMGVRVDPPRRLDLSETDPATGKPLRTIIKTTDPERYGIHVGDYFV